jgi:hypothetical protein
MNEFKRGDHVRLIRDVGKIKKGTEGTFGDYIDGMTAEIDFGETRWVTVNIADIEIPP